MIQLTAKETKIVKMVCDDKSNIEIAAKLKVSLRYTEKLKKKLYTKTKTGSGVSLLKWAVLNKHYKIKKK